MTASEPVEIPAALAAESVAVVRVLTGANEGRELVLNKNRTTLGKVGVQVAVIHRRAAHYYLSHIEGEQRPLVNGRVIEQTSQQLCEEDLIEISGVRMAFFFR